jgi:hypothetical protein
MALERGTLTRSSRGLFCQRGRFDVAVLGRIRFMGRSVEKDPFSRVSVALSRMDLPDEIRVRGADNRHPSGDFRGLGPSRGPRLTISNRQRPPTKLRSRLITRSGKSLTSTGWRVVERATDTLLTGLLTLC